jgi:hypothetical protein
MMIIGVDYHPSDQYIAFADTETGECGERRLNHSDGEAESSIAMCSRERSACGWEWRPPDIHVGLSGCSRNLASKCGSAMPRRSKPKESASRRPTATMRNCC